MIRTRRFFLAVVAAAALAAPALQPGEAQAREPRTLACSVSIEYLLNGTLRSTYAKDFTVAPGVPFSDDASTAIRFKFFDAFAAVAADGKSTDVGVSYFADTGALESVDFRTDLNVRKGKEPATTAATSTYWSSVGVAGEHTTKWSLTCSTLDD